MNFNHNLFFIKFKENNSFESYKNALQPNNWQNESFMQCYTNCSFRFMLNDKIKNLNNSSYKFIDIKIASIITSIFSNLSKS